MPTYDFHCTKCGLDFELQRPISQATDPAACPTDGAEAERVFTMPMTFLPGSSEDPATAAMPDFDAHGHDHGHGHSHGPGGHTH